MRIEEVQIDQIKVGKERRRINYEKVKSLAESIRAIGTLLHPVTLSGGYDLVAGGHRLEAYKFLGWKTIPATFIEDPDLADLMEADENLQRHNLDTLELSQAMKQRRSAWERIHGKPQPGRTPKGGNSATVAQFIEESAEVAGVSKRTVQLASEIGEKLTEKAAEVVADTPVAKSPKKLKAIADKPPTEQVAAAKQAVAEIKKPSKNGKPTGWHGDKIVEGHYGKLVRSIDEKAAAVGKGKHHKLCLESLSQFLGHWNDWKAAKA